MVKSSRWEPHFAVTNVPLRSRSRAKTSCSRIYAWDKLKLKQLLVFVFTGAGGNFSLNIHETACQLPFKKHIFFCSSSADKQIPCPHVTDDKYHLEHFIKCVWHQMLKAEKTRQKKLFFAGKHLYECSSCYDIIFSASCHSGFNM